LAIVRVADVQGKKVDWLWPGRIARGKLTILAGMPDVNKSTMTLDLTARVTTGSVLPCGEGRAPLGSVILLTAEDDVADTVRPRLEVAGADLLRTHVITATKAPGEERSRSFDLSQDVARLEIAAQEIGDVVLIVIDPISAYMGKPGKLDSYRSTDVRATLAPLQEMAARCGAAVIGIDHLNKSGGAQAMMRVLGSIAFVAAARAVYVVVRDEDDDHRRLMLPAKNNLGKVRTGLAFRVFEKLAPSPVFDAYPAIKWEDEPVTMTADEALAPKHDGRKSEAAEAAKILIAEMLAEKPMPQKEIELRAEAQGISHRSLTTAKKAMGVVSTKVGAAWWWSLPGKEKPI
jgi:putative DNA primase/helicase